MRRYRVRVVPNGKGAARVVLRKWGAGYNDFIRIASIYLDGDDADEQLADARARATMLADQINGLERDK